MKKQRFVKISVMLLAVMLCASVLSGCGGYSSHYKAIMFVHSNTAKSASMSFMSFEGTMVFILKYEAPEQLKYSAKLEEGSATVYYDCDGTKTELFSLKAGEEIESAFSPAGKGKLYVIVETSGECKEGNFKFDIE